MLVFQIGRPIGTARARSSALHSHTVTSIAASVGPYRLDRRASGSRLEEALLQARRQLLATANHVLQARALDRLDAPLRNTCSIDGTKCSVVTPVSSINLAQVLRILVTVGAGHNQASPARRNVQRNSHTDTSKLNGVF